MSLEVATWVAAIATVVLAAFAIVTAKYAKRAFEKQSQEVSDQAEMLDLQRKQLAAQEKTSAKQAEVLELQAKELGESLEQRKQAAEDKRRAQASEVTAWFAWDQVTNAMHPVNDWGATLRNASGNPVFDVCVTFNYIAEQSNGREWAAVPYGTLVKPVKVMPPMSERHLSIPSDVRAQIGECNDDVYAVSIMFADAAGNRWERDARGALNSLS
jgi:cell division protein FtsL